MEGLLMFGRPLVASGSSATQKLSLAPGIIVGFPYSFGKQIAKWFIWRFQRRWPRETKEALVGIDAGLIADFSLSSFMFAS